jgi:hypothetical protein
MLLGFENGGERADLRAVIILRSVARSRFSKSGWRSRLIQTVGGAKNEVAFGRSTSSSTSSGTGDSIRCVIAPTSICGITKTCICAEW